MKENMFMYQYSSKQNEEVEIIRKKYLPPEENRLETLKRLDLQVQNAGVAESLILGILGALIFGMGMCFGLNVWEGGFVPTVLLSLFGMIAMLLAYPLHCRMRQKAKQKLTPEILRLSEEMMKS